MNVSRIVDHIDHIKKLVGVDHIGIGSDFDGVQITTSDLATVAELPFVEIDFLETTWTKGFTIRNVDHQCGPHMMR